MGGDTLFYGGRDMYSVVMHQTASVKKRVEEIPSNNLLNASEEDLVQTLVQEFWMNVPSLKEQDIYIAEASETTVDVSSDPMRLIDDRSRPFYVPGNRTVIAVPFEGDAVFFKVQPATHTLNAPRAVIEGSNIILTFDRTDHDGEAITREYQQAVALIKQYLTWQRSSADGFNSALEGLVRTQISLRKERLLRNANMIASIGLPLKKRHDAPGTYALPVKRTVARVDRMATSAPFKPEPALSEEDYAHILKILRNMVTVMECSPQAFAGMGEEDLRTQFLVQLNAQYEGQASGETFNFQGKTDILLKADGKNAFIAECKFWKGEKALSETIDQLLSYLSWRDTKAAILVFNRNANFSAVLEKIADAVPKHCRFKRNLGKAGESSFHYIFGQPNDTNREVRLAVLAFDVPSSQAKPVVLTAGG